MQHACGLDANGAAFCWGEFFGINRFSEDHRLPGLVPGGIAFASLHAGAAHVCGLTFAGVAYCWGIDDYGSLGNGARSSPFAYEPVAVVGGHSFTALTMGGDNKIFASTCGLKADGSAYCWGANNLGQLGTTAVLETCSRINDLWFPCTGSPVKVAGVPPLVAIDAAVELTCGTTAGGEVWCWGANDQGQQGNGFVRAEGEIDQASRVLFPWEQAPGALAASQLTNVAPQPAWTKIVR